MSPLSIQQELSALRPRLIQTAHGPVECVDVGSGPAVVALHGAMGGWDQSLILARTVLPPAGSFRIIALSRPGYLGTPWASGAEPEAQADRVAALLNALDLPHATVIAISGGGPAALHFALRHPQRCASLILCSTVSGPNAFKVPRRFAFIKLMARFPFLVNRMRATAARKLEQSASRSVTDPLLRQRMLSDPEARSLFAALTDSTLDRMGQRIGGSENDFGVTQTRAYPLESLRVPTLIVHGTRDPFVEFTAHAVSAHRRIAGSELLPLEGGEHAAIFTHLAEVRARSERFLERVAAGGFPSAAPR